MIQNLFVIKVIMVKFNIGNNVHILHDGVLKRGTIVNNNNGTYEIVILGPNSERTNDKTNATRDDLVQGQKQAKAILEKKAKHVSLIRPLAKAVTEAGIETMQEQEINEQNFHIILKRLLFHKISNPQYTTKNGVNIVIKEKILPAQSDITCGVDLDDNIRHIKPHRSGNDINITSWNGGVYDSDDGGILHSNDITCHQTHPDDTRLRKYAEGCPLKFTSTQQFKDLHKLIRAHHKKLQDSSEKSEDRYEKYEKMLKSEFTKQHHDIDTGKYKSILDMSSIYYLPHLPNKVESNIIMKPLESKVNSIINLYDSNNANKHTCSFKCNSRNCVFNECKSTQHNDDQSNC